MSDRNWARGLLCAEALFVVIGGSAIALAPEEACLRMAELRGLAANSYACPTYSGAVPVFEMYAFSLGKHQALIALLFAYFALFGSSKAAINAGLVYLPIATLLDAVPVYTWLSSAGLVVSPLPRIIVLGAAFTGVALAAIPMNGRHREWATA